MAEPSGRLVLTAVLLGLLVGPLQAAPQWLAEYGSSDARPGAARDAGCDDPDSGPARFLSCGHPLGTSGEGGHAWAIGFDMPITAIGAGEARWWAGFRVGRHAASELRATLPQADAPDERLRADLSSAYALAQLRREWAPAAGRLRPYLAGGIGVARSHVRDFQRLGEESRQQAPDGNDSGYILRLETGVIWQLGERLHLGLALRQDGLDAYATPRGEGWVDEGDGREALTFDATRGRLAYRSVVVSVAWPFGAGDVGQ